MGPLVVGVNASLSSSPSPTIDALVVVHSLTSSLLHLATAHLPQKIEMFSLKSFVLLALLASVSANRDLLQGGFF